MWEKNKGTIKCDKKMSHMMLELYNVRMKSSNVRNNKGTTKCDKRSVTCDVGTAQYQDGTLKCEKQ